MKIFITFSVKHNREFQMTFCFIYFSQVRLNKNFFTFRVHRVSLDFKIVPQHTLKKIYDPRSLIEQNSYK